MRALPIVLVHGSMDRGAAFARVARHLPGHEVRRYDRRGYGRSVGEEPTDLDGHVADLLEQIGDVPAVVVGHSIGGVVALTAAARNPDVIPAVAAFEPPTPWVPWWPARSAGSSAVVRAAADGADPGDAAEAFMRRMVGDRRWEALPEATRRSRRAEGPALVAELTSVRDGVAPFDAATFPVPVVLGRGTEARPHHVRSVDELAKVLPDVEVVVIEGATHGAHLSHPEEFAAFAARAVERAAAERPG